MARRWLRRTFTGILILFVGIPTLLAVFHFAVVALHACRAREIVLEEFCPALPPVATSDVVLQHRVLPRSEYWRVVLSMPPVPDASAYGIEKLCYDPQHRIIMKRGDSTHQVEICFECSKIRFDSPWLGGIPLLWQRTLHSLFTHYGMPERSTEEYSKLRRAAPNQKLERIATRKET
jgi:hypothetical protein